MYRLAHLGRCCVAMMLKKNSKIIWSWSKCWQRVHTTKHNGEGSRLQLLPFWSCCALGWSSENVFWHVLYITLLCGEIMQILLLSCRGAVLKGLRNCFISDLPNLLLLVSLSSLTLSLPCMPRRHSTSRSVELEIIKAFFPCFARARQNAQYWK